MAPGTQPERRTPTRELAPAQASLTSALDADLNAIMSQIADRTRSTAPNHSIQLDLDSHLSAVRQIVELHGGRTWVDSTLGEASAFQFVLPLGAAPAGDDAKLLP